MSKIIELFGHGIQSVSESDWSNIIQEQRCLYTNTKCFKVRKSEPEISIGTCTVNHGKGTKNIIICPRRLLQNNQVFTDCIHLLMKHEPGNEFHIVPEVSIPGGSVDYFLVSVKNKKVRDFVGIEFQTLDTTGTIYPERQRLLGELGFYVDDENTDSTKPFGINWKMTAKTILVQLHHKIGTFEHIGKHLVLIIQDYLLDYMKRQFSFGHLSEPSGVGDSMHIHAYSLKPEGSSCKLHLVKRLSTDAEGMARCLGLRAETKVELEEIIKSIESKLSDATLLSIV
ncbi:MAG: hypothetical protein LGR52_15260 [Candidatus Thiosymbion ectosymbiont of Robbea hypermnestra]|nr:hypothetical protein [Candidatus Thiosymbion ectosymbiont of Robbea hypermnestra]